MELNEKALLKLISKDAKLWDNFVWTESSNIKNLIWDQAGAIQIPNEYISLFMDEKMLNTVDIRLDELYAYDRIVNNGNPIEERRFSKTIYAFPNKNVMLKYIEHKDSLLKEIVDKVRKDKSYILNNLFHQNEHYKVAPKEIWQDLKILIYYDKIFTNERLSHFTQYEMDVLVDCARTVNKGLGKYWGHMNSKDEKALYSLILSSMIMANSCSIIKPYKLGEMLIPEQRRFEAEEMYPSCLY